MPDPELRRSLAYVAPYWRRLMLVVVLTLVGTALSLVIPYLSKVLVDTALIGRSPSALFRIVGAYAGITIVLFGVNVASGLLYTRVSADILFDMRLAVFRHLQRLSPRFYARMPLGQIVSRINADVSEIQRVVSDAALSWISNLLLLVGTVTMLIVLDMRLFLVSLLTLPPALWVLIRYRRNLESAVANMRERSAEIGTFLIESLRGMRLIVSSNAEAREVARFAARNDSFIDGLMRLRRVTYVAGGLPGLLVSVSTAAVFLYGGLRVIDASLSLGTLVAFMAYQARLLGPVQGLMGLYTSLATARVSLRRVHEILDEPVEVVEVSEPLGLDRVTGALELDSVTFSHGRGVILDQVSMRIAPGETVAIAGRSGTGKSSIADLFLRHVDPDGGRVLLDGHDVRQLSLAQVRSAVVAVEQEPFLFHASIADNVRFVAPHASDDHVRAALEAAALGDLLKRLPDGMHTIVGESGHAMSAGERQRIAVARAHLQDPAVLIFDEATSNLDDESQNAVFDGCASLMRDRTTVIISHRPDVQQRADRVITIEGGQLTSA